MTDPFFLPVSGLDLPRFAGLPSFMRLPVLAPDHPRRGEVELGLFGIPWDGGTTNRAGARHGPRQVRDLSTMIRRVNPASGIDPFALVACADLGDVGPNPTDLMDSLARIEGFVAGLREAGIVPVAVGGDHLSTLPVLRGLAGGRALGLIHFDSHTDLNDSYFNGSRYTHGTPFRRAVEEGLLDPARMIQIGIRGTQYGREDFEFAAGAGIRIVTIEEVFDRGIPAVMAEAREIVGSGETYVSFDIDFVDPAYAPGTGTPEIGGPTAFQAQTCVRALAGLNLIGADLVEVAPPFDPGGGTAWLAASLLFELLCVLAPATVARRGSRGMGRAG